MRPKQGGQGEGAVVWAIHLKCPLVFKTFLYELAGIQCCGRWTWLQMFSQGQIIGLFQPFIKALVPK